MPELAPVTIATVCAISFSGYVTLLARKLEIAAPISS
jgi:hypothetical protein